jgi:quercetin dioxygenase-like cupin family protein
MTYTYVDDLVKAVDVPKNGITSHTVFQDEYVKVVLFGFDAGQELSEHTASMPAVLHFLQGQARVTLGQDAQEAQAGTWIHLPARLPHSLYAKTPVIMLLTLVKSGKCDPESAAPAR